jgi:hypothetical protein
LLRLREGRTFRLSLSEEVEVAKRLTCWLGRHTWTTRVAEGESYKVCSGCGNNHAVVTLIRASRPGGPFRGVRQAVPSQVATGELGDGEQADALELRALVREARPGPRQPRSSPAPRRARHRTITELARAHATH